MDEEQVILALSALAQPTRLNVFKTLVACAPDGTAAGDLARLCKVPQNTMSSHLAILSRAGLIRAARQGRSILYSADLAGFRAMTLHLVQDCCGGHPEVCAPLVADLMPRCSPKVCLS
jgi:ArsR family transcriptional regulator